MLRGPRFEVIPTDSIEQTVVQSVPRDVTMTVTASPSKGLEATIGLAERLAKHGYCVVPHISARLVVDGAHLEEIVARLTACGIDDIFVPAGGSDSSLCRRPGQNIGPKVPDDHHRACGLALCAGPRRAGLWRAVLWRAGLRRAVLRRAGPACAGRSSGTPATTGRPVAGSRPWRRQ